MTLDTEHTHSLAGDVYQFRLRFIFKVVNMLMTVLKYLVLCAF